MENHPIPQNVTGFQFKLIGSMTVKQFAFLATGVIFGWIAFSLPLPFLIRPPLAALFALLGVLFAFVPMSGRPMDTMILYFLQALFSPNQYFYQKEGAQLLPPALPSPKKSKPHPKRERETVASYIATLPSTTRAAQPLDTREETLLASVFTPSQQVPKDEPRIIAEQGEQKEAPKKEDLAQSLAEAAHEIEEEIEKARREEETKVDTVEKEKLHHTVEELESKLAEVLSQKQQVEKQLAGLLVALDKEKKPQTFVPTTATPKAATPNVRTIPKSMGKTVGLPIVPDAPNLLTGVIKDSRGNVLPNILVEVKDALGNPKRAFKTNVLGQFAAATPLTNDTYTIQFEDPGGSHVFDAVELTVDGTTIPPLEVISEDAREKLRKELFGG